MIDVKQFRELIVRPVLKNLHMWSYSAEELLMGTFAQESRCGTYLKQLGDGPALGVFQMEPATAKDVVYRYIDNRDDLEERFERAFQLVNSSDIEWAAVDLEKVGQKLVSDLRFATALARMRYWMDPEPLPDANDIEGLANTWKRVYNTELGKGKVPEFVHNYRTLILGK